MSELFYPSPFDGVPRGEPSARFIFCAAPSTLAARGSKTTQGDGYSHTSVIVLFRASDGRSECVHPRIWDSNVISLLVLICSLGISHL